MGKFGLFTGAGRGLGVDIAKKALAAGHSVVATGRSPAAVLNSGELPLRFVAGADAMAAVEANLKTIQAQIDAHRSLSAALVIGE